MTRETRQTVAVPDRESRSLARGLLFLAAVIALLWILATGRPPRPTLMWSLAYDLGHIPLFGVMAVCLFEASRALLGGGRVRGGTHYLIAFVVVAAISLLSELAQIGVVGREAQARDAVHAQAIVHHRVRVASHLAGADGVEDGRAEVARSALAATTCRPSKSTTSDARLSRLAAPAATSASEVYTAARCSGRKRAAL